MIVMAANPEYAGISHIGIGTLVTNGSFKKEQRLQFQPARQNQLEIGIRPFRVAKNWIIVFANWAFFA
jgi:hypothetical protein